MGRVITGSVVDVGGPITEDTTWAADLVRVTDSVAVAPEATLTIAAGTRVEFTGFFRLLVQGRLWAVGEPGQRIHFTAAVDQLDEGWDGIEFLNVPAARDSSRLEHCVLSGAVARPADSAVADRIVGGTARPETGGALSIVNVNKLAIASCEFVNNRASYGGAIYCGYGATPVLAGNLFHGNTALWNGSVLFSVYAYPKLINNTIAANTCLAESDFFLCGAVDSFNGKPLLVNNIIRDNHTNHYSGTQLVAIKDYYTLTNNIQAYAGNGTNVDEEAGFFGAGVHPYQLIEGSVCVDAGQGHELLGALAVRDIAGADRIFGMGVDMGAYEYSGTISAIPVTGPQLNLAAVPNPFNPRTRIVYDLPLDGPVDLRIYDLRGRLMRTLIDSWQGAGRHEVDWDGWDDGGRALASGTYLYQLQVGPEVVTRSVTLVR